MSENKNMLKIYNIGRYIGTLSTILYIFLIISIVVSAEDNKGGDNDKNSNKWITSSKIIDTPSSILDKGRQDVIIGFKGSEKDAIDMVHKQGGRVKRVLEPIKAISSKLSPTDIEKLKKDPNVRYIEQDVNIYIDSQSVPWGIIRVNATLVHSNYKGTGVKVVVIDTGIDYLHPDLDNNYIGGYDYVNEDNDPIDDNGHGTHVSGTIAAEDNGIGVIGVAPDAKIYAVKAFDSNGIGWLSDIVPAIYDSADNGADIISMSWHINGDYQSLHDAINYAYNKGMILIAAAGNGHGNAIAYPAAYPEVIAVTATDDTDNIASLSNIGPEAELSAPGVNIYSTIPGGGYGYKSGTSMAVPHVSGVAALIKSSHLYTTSTEIRQVMQTHAVDLGPPGRDIYYGYGLVNANFNPICNGNTPIGQNIQTVPTINVNMIFDSVTQCGDTTVSTSGNQWKSLPNKYNSIKFYNINTTATYTNSIMIKMSYSDSYIPSDINESSIRLFHYENEDWIDVTTSLDINSNNITGIVTSLSPFSIAGIITLNPTVIPTTNPNNIIKGSSFDIIGFIILIMSLAIIGILKLKTRYK